MQVGCIGSMHEQTRGSAIVRVEGACQRERTYCAWGTALLPTTWACIREENRGLMAVGLQEKTNSSWAMREKHANSWTMHRWAWTFLDQASWLASGLSLTCCWALNWVQKFGSWAQQK